MADNSNRWRQDAERIAQKPSSAPTYKAPPPTQQRQVVQAEVNRIRNTPPINKAKSS